MRCFIVGGRELARGRVRMGSSCAVASCGVTVLRAASVAGTAATALVVISPSDVHSARKAVTTAVHRFTTVLRVMVPLLSGGWICILSS
jgi:hypothetical protein